MTSHNTQTRPICIGPEFKFLSRAIILASRAIFEPFEIRMSVFVRESIPMCLGIDSCTIFWTCIWSYSYLMSDISIVKLNSYAHLVEQCNMEGYVYLQWEEVKALPDWRVNNFEPVAFESLNTGAIVFGFFLNIFLPRYMVCFLRSPTWNTSSFSIYIQHLCRESLKSRFNSQTLKPRIDSFYDSLLIGHASAFLSLNWFLTLHCE